MRKRFLSLAVVAFSFLASAMAQNLKGFAYGDVAAPSGGEWESPTELALNKEQPKGWFFTFADEESARKVLPEFSEYYMSLDGTWSFNWVGNPWERPEDFYKPDYDVSSWDKVEVPMNWNVYGLQKDGSQKYGTPIYVNQDRAAGAGAAEDQGVRPGDQPLRRVDGPRHRRAVLPGGPAHGEGRPRRAAAVRGHGPVPGAARLLLRPAALCPGAEAAQRGAEGHRCAARADGHAGRLGRTALRNRAVGSLCEMFSGRYSLCNDH